VGEIVSSVSLPPTNATDETNTIKVNFAAIFIFTDADSR
jgi:hypothetical protein